MNVIDNNIFNFSFLKGCSMLKAKRKQGVKYLFNSTFRARKPKLPKRKKVKARPTELTEHFKKVLAIGPAPGHEGVGRMTVHHCHSGSIAEHGITRGFGQKASDWLVIALPQELHVMSPTAIDGSIGVVTWEQQFGTQFDALCWLSRKLGYNVFKKAGFNIAIDELD
jgi:hypothetical protein